MHVRYTKGCLCAFFTKRTQFSILIYLEWGQHYQRAFRQTTVSKKDGWLAGVESGALPHDVVDRQLSRVLVTCMKKIWCTSPTSARLKWCRLDEKEDHEIRWGRSDRA
jgi:hypothetical protein